jgi:hypothetical protein
MPGGRFACPRTERRTLMVVLGVDAHKRTHTIVIIDERSRRIARRTINATTADHLALMTWAQALWAVRLPASVASLGT